MDNGNRDRRGNRGNMGCIADKATMVKANILFPVEVQTRASAMVLEPDRHNPVPQSSVNLYL